MRVLKTACVIWRKQPSQCEHCNQGGSTLRFVADSPQDMPWHVYTDKAGLYARFRWDYAPELVAKVASRTGLTPDHAVADIGAGTGILTQHFLDRAKRVYCVEPNVAMLREADSRLSSHPAFVSVRGRAEATGLPDNSVHLIVAGMAFDWFQPEEALREFQRILSPVGWLAVFRYKVDGPLLRKMSGYLWELPQPPRSIRPGTNDPDRYMTVGYLTEECKCSCEETFEQYIGGVSATEGAPSLGSPEYNESYAAHRRAFLALSVDGKLRMEYTCVATVGRLRQP
jgi:ubiquinone/menaquinone biosynthesis C-methylase UbiE